MTTTMSPLYVNIPAVTTIEDALQKTHRKTLRLSEDKKQSHVVPSLWPGGTTNPIRETIYPAIGHPNAFPRVYPRAPKQHQQKPLIQRSQARNTIRDVHRIDAIQNELGCNTEPKRRNIRRPFCLSRILSFSSSFVSFSTFPFRPLLLYFVYRSSGS